MIVNFLAIYSCEAQEIFDITPTTYCDGAFYYLAFSSEMIKSGARNPTITNKHPLDSNKHPNVILQKIGQGCVQSRFNGMSELTHLRINYSIHL